MLQDGIISVCMGQFVNRSLIMSFTLEKIVRLVKLSMILQLSYFYSSFQAPITV